MKKILVKAIIKTMFNLISSNQNNFILLFATLFLENLIEEILDNQNSDSNKNL